MRCIALLLLLVLTDPAQAGQATLSTLDRNTIASDVANSHPAGALSLLAMDAERGVAEFMSVCVRPMWDMPKTVAAVAHSDLTYVEQSKVADSGRWLAKRAYLALEQAPDPSQIGEGLPQCQLSLGSIQPRTSLQLTMVLKAALDAELGRTLPVLQNEYHDSYVEWNTDGTEVMNRVTVEGESAPTQSITYVFERWSPHGLAYRKELVRQFQESPKK